MTDTATHLSAVLTDLAVVVDGIDPARRADPTPCAEYDVAALTHHVAGWLDTFAAGFADPDGRAPRADLSGFPAPTDAGTAIREATGRLDQAVADGAADRPLYLGGEQGLPGDLALGLVLAEYQVHGWDLAVATGQGWAPDADGLEASVGFLDGMLTEDFQGEGKSFGPRVAVAPDADALTRLVAVSGRDPGWTPPR
jgi:uncharacterized protein (TIGR03086 family)